ncbi:hypothetical protein As57867_009081, partial [Aphanomyces stellatus]
MVMHVDAVTVAQSTLEEFDILVAEIEACAATAKKASCVMLGASGDDQVSVLRSKLVGATQSLEACSTAVQTALAFLGENMNGKGFEAFEDVTDESDAAKADDGIADESITPSADGIESAPTSTGVYPSEDEVVSQSHAPIDHSALTPEVQVETLNHLMFVIHGIGEHADFTDGHWDKTPTLEGEYPVFQDLFRTTRDAYFKEIPLALEIQSIEWHAELHATGVDPVFDMIAPEGSEKIRQFNKRAFMDLLYYTAPKFSQLIVTSVTSQLNAKYKRFLELHPGWTGQVSIFSHSLGTIIAYDILTHDAGDVSAIGVTFPGLDFPVENLFCAGSPVPVMVLSRGDVNLSTDGRFTEGIKAPKVNHYYNLFHPLDPIAYRVEPLLHANTSDLPAVQLVAADTLKTKSFGQIVELYDAVASPTRQDFVLRRQQREGPIELAYAPFSHSSYWTSQDVVLFTLLQVCRP